MEPRIEKPKSEQIPAIEDGKSKLSGWLVGIVVFVIAYAIFVHTAKAWGVALGWAPSAAIATAIGWIAYCFPWLLDLLWILFEILGALLG